MTPISPKTIEDKLDRLVSNYLALQADYERLEQENQQLKQYHTDFITKIDSILALLEEATLIEQPIPKSAQPTFQMQTGAVLAASEL